MNQITWLMILFSPKLNHIILLSISLYIIKFEQYHDKSRRWTNDSIVTKILFLNPIIYKSSHMKNQMDIFKIVGASFF